MQRLKSLVRALPGTHLGTLLSGFYAVFQIGIRLVENERQEARRAAYYQRSSGQRGQPQQTQRERQLQVRRAFLNGCDKRFLLWILSQYAFFKWL